MQSHPICINLFCSQNLDVTTINLKNVRKLLPDHKSTYYHIVVIVNTEFWYQQ